MAWALQFDGVNDRATFDQIALSGDFSIIFSGIRFSDLSDNHFIIGHSSITSAWVGKFGTSFAARVGGSNAVLPTTPSVDVDYNITVSRVGSLVTISEPTLGSGTVNSTAIVTLNQLGRFAERDDWLFAGRLQNVSITNSTVNRGWDATASDHNSGSDPTTNPFILIDTVGGNDATGVNMTTANWIDLGGGETPVTVTDSLTNTSSSNNNDTVNFVGAFNINDSVVNSLSQSNNDSITLAALLTVNDSITSSSVANSSDTIKVVGEFSIAEVTTNSNVINNADSVNFAASLLVNDSTSSTNSIDNNDDVLLVGEFSIIDGQSITTTSANSDSVSFASIVSVADSNTSSSSNNNNDSVLFVGQFNIDDIASSASSISNADTIKLVGKVNVVDSKTNTVSSSNNDTVLIGTFTFSVNQETNITALYRSTNINAVTLSTNING